MSDLFCLGEPQHHFQVFLCFLQSCQSLYQLRSASETSNCPRKPLSPFEIAPSFCLSLVSLGRRQLPFISMASLNTLGVIFLQLAPEESQNKVAHLKHFPHGCPVLPFRKKIIGYHGNQLPQHSILTNHTGIA